MLAAMRAPPAEADGAAPSGAAGDAPPSAALLHPLAMAGQPVVVDFDTAPAAPSAPAAPAAPPAPSAPSAPAAPAAPSAPSVPSPPPAPPAVDEADLEALMQLGFEEAACRAALTRHGGDRQQAEDWLLSN